MARRNSSKTYQVWKSMHWRCSPGTPDWKNYGGRGISVCERWCGVDGFVNFLADMGERPESLTLDRIDNDHGYGPGNCRWATRKEQRANRRVASTEKLSADLAQEIRGRSEHGELQASIAARIGVHRSMISLVVNGLRWPEAVSSP